jgi:hypothetical protein
MLKLVDRFRLGRDDIHHTSSSLVIYKGGYSSIGRTAECGTVGSLFDPGYPPYLRLG